jgi:fibronectin-binding autotransporter adhesin
MAIIVVLSMMIVSSQAANRWWDGTNTVSTGDGASDGGTATWDTTTLNWDQGNGIDRVAWTNANNDTAIFAGSAGAVTLGTGITIGGLQFDTASYTIVGSGNVLTWGTAGSIVANQNATIGPIMAGSVAITKSGTGAVTLSSKSTYTGGTTVNEGTLILGAGGNVGTLRGALTINSGATVTSTAANALGIATSVSPLNINDGTLDLSFGQHHIWGSTVNMVGGTLKFSSNIDNEQFNVVYNSSNSTSQAQILAQTGGAMRMRDSVSTPCITFNVEDGAQDVDLLVDVRIIVGTGVGGLTKNGAGAMKLTKANTYNGPTVISDGTLIMNGSHSGGGLSYTVTVGGALSGTGTISSAVTVDGVIAPGDGGIGQLTVGNVKWAAGPAWPFELGAAPSGDLLAINGGFTNNGGTGFAFDLQNTGVAGVYTLVTWTASTTFTNTDFSATNVPAGLTPAFTMNTNSLMLELTSSGGGDITAEATNTLAVVVGGQFTFGFNIASGALYRVQASTNLVDPVDNGFTNITSQLTNQQAGTIIYTNTTSDLLQMFRITSP